jgi:hypothetical protein
MRRQVRNSQAWLPAGCQITAYYWDVESGGLDLDQRGQAGTWQAVAAAGIPRDGGIADLLHEAKSPTPNFAFVVCEDIERSAPIDPADPAAAALRNRIRARFTELYGERISIEAELAALEEPATGQDDPTLLDELPTLGDILTGAPAGLTENCWPSSTSKPSTTGTNTRSPSTPPSPMPPPRPS